MGKERLPLLSTDEWKALNNAKTPTERKHVLFEIKRRLHDDFVYMEKQFKRAEDTERASCDHEWAGWGSWEKICNKCGLVVGN